MESTTDFDLEELESRLYSQVFHSTENWDSLTINQDFNSCNDQTRHVTLYSINNTTVNGKRYWDGKNILKDIDNNNKDTNLIQPITHQEPHLSTNSKSICENNLQQNNNILPVLESIIPLSNTINQEYRSKPLKYKSFTIPTTLKLPISNTQIFPDEIIQFFELNSKRRRKNFREFLRFLENQQSCNNIKQGDFKTKTVRSKKYKDKNAIKQQENSTKITITVDGKDIALSHVLKPETNDSLLFKKETDNTEIITLSDSDNDSVVEVPLSPVPIYNIESSSESEKNDNEFQNNEEEITENQNVASSNVDNENSINSVFSEKHNIETEHFNDNSLEKQALSNFENVNLKNKIDMNISFTELEKERDEFLHTPDSNNDFLEHDVSTISKNNFRFNFGLHSSDLDLSKDKEEPFSKPTITTNEHDLYETESSCSEVGSVTKARAVFNEINFESPIKDIFCEPDLSKFSNFITPNRNTQSKTRLSKPCSNTLFTPIQTKASTKNTEIIEQNVPEDNKRRNRSESSEYHSDPTTLKINKKSKKTKKKVKKRKEPKNVSETSLSEKDTSSDVIKKSKEIEEINSQNEIISSDLPSPSKQIEILKFGARSKTDSNIDYTISETNLNLSINNQKQGRNVSDYYVDTYFADDCLLLEELEKQQANSKNETETNVNVSSIKTPNKDICKKTHNSQCKSSNNDVHFSFLETWKKSSNRNSDSRENTERESFPNKKIKTNNVSTIHPYVVTVLSDTEDSNDCNVINNNSEKTGTLSKTATTEEDYTDVIIANIQNDNKNSTIANIQSPEDNKFSFINTYLQNKEKTTFKDFWTFDMKKFYEESWGQENFDLRKVQSSMSGKESDWKIVPADLSPMFTKKRGLPCLRCREYGHSQYNCTRYSRPIKCTTCGYAGHTSNRCPNAICTRCRSVVHHHTTSCGNCTHFNTIFCTLCKIVGHETQHCPDLWRRYHLTTDNNTKLQTSSFVLKSPSHRWCCNCSKQGHFEDNCTYLRREHFPTTTGIISYIPTYDDVFKLPVSTSTQIIPLFKNANVTINDLKSLKNDAIITSNKKYVNILKQLRQQCHKYNIPLIDDIDRLERNTNNREFSRKNINEIYKIRARIAKQKFL